ncbi:MAG: hypothetical protein R2771_16175 [Saprospiraceae bacterium]
MPNGDLLFKTMDTNSDLEDESYFGLGRAVVYIRLDPESLGITTSAHKKYLKRLKLLLYPNPAKTYFTIDYDGKETCKNGNNGSIGKGNYARKRIQ